LGVEVVDDEEDIAGGRRKAVVRIKGCRWSGKCISKVRNVALGK
jgi:hypothetical protein